MYRLCRGPLPKTKKKKKVKIRCRRNFKDICLQTAIISTVQGKKDLGGYRHPIITLKLLEYVGPLMLTSIVP
jgi:hypothetical protein